MGMAHSICVQSTSLSVRLGIVATTYSDCGSLVFYYIKVTKVEMRTAKCDHVFMCMWLNP